MTKSIAVLQKKRGRPATGSDPLLNFRASPDLVKAIDKWAAALGDEKPSRSEAIRRLVGLGLSAAPQAALDEHILIEEEKIARRIPKGRSSAKGMPKSCKGLAENEHRKLIARKEARAHAPGSEQRPKTSSGQKGNDIQDATLTRPAPTARTKKRLQAMTDELAISPDQAKGARKLLGMGKLHVCRELGITPLTLDRAEIARTRAGPPQGAVLNRLRRFYEAAGVEFVNSGKMGVSLKSNTGTLSVEDLNSSNDK